MSNQSKPPSEDQPEKPVLPIDMMMARFELWIERMEKREAEIRAQQHIPDDIPRFITREP